VSESEASITPPKQEVQVPEKNTVERLNWILRSLGRVTRRSRIPHEEKNVSRPISLRTKRAELLKKIKGNDSDVRRRVIAEARARDEIASQYLNQGEVPVNHPKYGELKARFTMIEPPKSRKSLEEGSKPPIFLIPGIGNDIDCVGTLAQELPFEGRSVIVVGYPESVMGTTTEKFAQAVEASDDYGPHTDFYKEAINSLLGEKGEFELWGFSTGAPISAEILTDPEFQKRVTDAVYLSPASAVEQKIPQLMVNSAMEIKKIAKKFSTLGKYTLTSGIILGGRGRSEDYTPVEKGERKLKKKVIDSLTKKVAAVSSAYGQEKVKEGGSIVVVSGDEDDVVRSRFAKERFGNNPLVKFLNIVGGSHATPLTEPEKVLPKIFETQKKRD